VTVPARSPSGVLVIDKPSGWTSFDVVGFVRRRTGVKRVGHAGTLDPAATGVLPVALGQATRLIEYLADATKTYEAEVRLGLETDTYDLDGAVVAERDASAVTAAATEKALTAFRGEFEQVPPAFSAIKRQGVPLYKLARRGEAVEPAARRVRVDRLEALAFTPPTVRLVIDCAKGFYVRSLAHDLGRALGVGGTLAALRRTRVGSFSLTEAVDIETLAREMESDAWQERLFPPDEIVLGWPAAILGETNARRVRNGLPASMTASREEERCRAYSEAGELIALLRREDEAWRPDKVFA
jgi:tRNA pseudouridine55 synthase